MEKIETGCITSRYSNWWKCEMKKKVFKNVSVAIVWVLLEIWERLDQVIVTEFWLQSLTKWWFRLRKAIRPLRCQRLAQLIMNQVVSASRVVVASSAFHVGLNYYGGLLSCWSLTQARWQVNIIQNIDGEAFRRRLECHCPQRSLEFPTSRNILTSKAQSGDKTHSNTHSLPFFSVVVLLRFSGLR